MKHVNHNFLKPNIKRFNVLFCLTNDLKSVYNQKRPENIHIWVAGNTEFCHLVLKIWIKTTDSENLRQFFCCVPTRLSSPLPLLHQRHQQLHGVVCQLRLGAPHRQVVDHLLQKVSHNPLGPLCVRPKRCAQGDADLRKDEEKDETVRGGWSVYRRTAVHWQWR